MHSCIWRLRQVNKEDRIFHFVWLFTSTCSLSLKDHCILLPILSFCCCCFRREGKFSPIAPSWPQVSLSALFLVKKIIDYDTTCMIRHFSHVRLFVTPWTEACQAPLSMGFSRQEYWSGLPFPPSAIMMLTAYISLCNRLIWRNKILAPIPSLITNQVS